MPQPPMSGKILLPPDNARKAPTGFWPVLRPMVSSATITGKPTAKQHTKYTRMKAAPPFSATTLGYFQMLPRPTAEPAAAMMNPNLELQFPRLAPVSTPAKVTPFLVSNLLEKHYPPRVRNVCV